jgi:hypothetical protein
MNEPIISNRHHQSSTTIHRIAFLLLISVLSLLFFPHPDFTLPHMHTRAYQEALELGTYCTPSYLIFFPFAFLKPFPFPYPEVL